MLVCDPEDVSSFAIFVILLPSSLMYIRRESITCGAPYRSRSIKTRHSNPDRSVQIQKSCCVIYVIVSFGIILFSSSQLSLSLACRNSPKKNRDKYFIAVVVMSLLQHNRPSRNDHNKRYLTIKREEEQTHFVRWKYKSAHKCGKYKQFKCNAKE